jgi:DNA-directed RNA polymerase specialized sigma subunit
VLGSIASWGDAGQQPGTHHQHDELWQAFRCLDAREQEVVRLVVIDGLAKKVVARQLGLSLSELTDVYVVALQKLKQHLSTVEEN